MNLYDAVYQRISTRTYENKHLQKHDIRTIKQVLATYQTMRGPFGDYFDFTFNLNDAKETNGKKIGTYGLLKNVPAYIGGTCRNATESIIDFGYVFEHIVLELTALGFGTCWLGGTFKRKDYRRALRDDEIIPAISPVGFKASNRSIVDKMLRSTAQSDRRLPFDTLFVGTHNFSLQTTLREELKDCLSMVRKGPSASNKQPWRLVFDHEQQIFHLYIERTKNYAKFLDYDIQALDIGIALAHLEIGLQHYNIPFQREKCVSYPEKENWHYFLSLKLTT